MENSTTAHAGKGASAMTPQGQGYPSRRHSWSNDDGDVRTTAQIATHPYAGRLGGNVEFILDRRDPRFAKLVKEVPDSQPWITWRESFSSRPFCEVDLWKQAVIECWGTSMIVFITGLFSVQLAPVVSQTSVGPLLPAVIGNVLNAITLALFIFTAGPTTGGHLNPTITIGTFFAQLSTFARTVLYVAFQCLGAVIGGFLVRAGVGLEVMQPHAIAGCYVDSSLVSAGSVFALETMSCLTLLFLGFGVGLEPRQSKVFGPAMAPILVGFVLGLCAFASAFARPGYTGVSLNPARCLGLMAASGQFTYHYVHWAGPITASLIHGVFYWLVPPYLSKEMSQSPGEKI